MVRQTNFGGGEIAPMSWGRSDRSFFARGLRTMRNFFPTKQHGAAVSRSGSLYIGQTKDNGRTVRLLPFVYSDSQSFCIEMGIYGAGRNLYFRFFTNGAQLQGRYAAISVVVGTIAVGDTVTGGTSGAIAEIVSIKTDAGVMKLQVAVASGAFVAGETLTATSGGTATYNSEAYEVLEIQAGTTSAGFDIMKVKYAQLGAVLVLTHPDWPAIELRQYANVGNQVKFVQSNVSLFPPNPYFVKALGSSTYPVITNVGAAGPTTPDREWVYLVTLTVQDWVTGRIFETLPWRVTEQWTGAAPDVPVTFSPDSLSIYLENPLTLTRMDHLDGPAAAENVENKSFKVIQTNYYRGRGAIPGGVYGYVGSTGVINGDFVDLGREPDYFTPPPLGTHPFKVTKEDGTIVFEKPYAVAFFQDKLVFGGTLRRPGTVFTSETGAFDRFDLNTIVHSAGEALVFELASRKFEQIVHLVPHQKLIIGTGSSVWSMSGAQGGVLDFDSVDARVVDEVGMTGLAPLIIDGLVLFARTKGSGVRALDFNGQAGVYEGADISGQSDHLFVGDSVGEVGTATNKAIVDWTYAEDPWGLVWAVRADGLLLSLTLGADGAYGWARHDGSPTTGSVLYGNGTPAAYKRVCAVPEGDEDAVYVMVSRAVAGGFANCIERMTSRVRRGTAFDDGCLDSAVLVNQSTPAVNIQGLEHLEGESVYVCAKGNEPQGPFTVAGGEINLHAIPVANYQTTRCLLYVGLLFTADLELLDVVSADSRLKQKAVARIGFEVDQSGGILLGTDFEHLSDSRPNTVESGWTAPVPRTQIVTINPERKWDTGGRACLRQSLPRPVTVVGAVREFEVGG